MKQKLSTETILIMLSLALQIPLAVYLGHYYDDRVFMATGYLVGTGLNPYSPHNLAGIFPPNIISGFIQSIGYPPPYPLLLGLIYKITFQVNQNVFAYNFALKVPIIIANITLAYLIKGLLIKSKISQRKTQIAFVLILFNPFILLTTAAWGEIDTIVATFCLSSLYLLSKNRTASCAILLGLAAAIKPIALPLAGLPLVYQTSQSNRRDKLLYLTLFAITFLGLYFGPFLAAGWTIPLGPNEWNAHQEMAGGMTLFNIIGLFQPTNELPKTLSFLGYLWIPALIATNAIIYRIRPNNFADLIKMSIVTMLTFFLTRTWLSEPNINLLLPLLIVAASLGELKIREFHMAWIIPLAFMIPNYALPQLFFIVNPSIMQSIQLFNNQYGIERVLAQFALALAFQIFAITIINRILKQKSHDKQLAKRKTEEC